MASTVGDMDFLSFRSGLGRRRRRSAGRRRHDQSLHFLETADLSGQPAKLGIESLDLSGALQLDQLPFIVGVLAHGVAQLGLGADFILLGARLKIVLGLGPQSFQGRRDEVGVGSQLGNHLPEPGPVVRTHFRAHRFGSPGAGRVQAVQPAGNLLADAEKPLDLGDVMGLVAHVPPPRAKNGLRRVCPNLMQRCNRETYEVLVCQRF